jgi:hypothetical protein
MPGDTDVPGWKIKPDKTERYGRDDIAEKLKDGYAVYEKYGCRELVTAGYVRVDDPEIKIDIEIYRFNSSLNAFGIFSFERAFLYDDSSVCGNSYTAVNSFIARKGEFYIKVNANKNHKGISGDLIAFGEAVCAGIVSEDRPLPDYIVLYSRNGYKDVVYRAVELPFLPGFNNFFLCKKNISGNNKIIFFANRGTGIDSYSEFSKFLTLEVNPFVLLSTGKSHVAFRKNGESDFLFISSYNEWLLGVISAGSMREGREIVDILLEELIEFLNRKG